MHKQKISVIIPVYNEEETILKCLKQFTPFEKNLELIVINNESTDKTTDIVQQQILYDKRIKLFNSQKGRSIAMNNGASKAKGDIYLFLHSDTILPLNSLELIRDSMNNIEYLGGFFNLQHKVNSQIYKYFSPIINCRSKHTKILFGDQAIFVKQEIFKKLKGYKDIPIMEDYDFAKRLYKSGKLVRIQEPVITSSRRFEKQGTIKYMLLCNVIFGLYKLGFSPKTLTKIYEDIR